MPIRDVSVYPPDWPEIRAEILERAEHACEWCGLADRIEGYRDQWGDFVGTWEADAQLMRRARRKLIKIVLTVAHLDHQPGNNGAPGDRPNLAALCQKCHNGHDAPMRAKHAAATRHAKMRRACGDLFGA